MANKKQIWNHLIKSDFICSYSRSDQIWKINFLPKSKLFWKIQKICTIDEKDLYILKAKKDYFLSWTVRHFCPLYVKLCFKLRGEISGATIACCLLYLVTLAQARTNLIFLHFYYIIVCLIWMLFISEKLYCSNTGTLKKISANGKRNSACRKRIFFSV